MTVDVWMQHPTRRFLADEMFEPLRRWVGEEIPSAEIPLEVSVASMDQAQVDVGLLSAWRGPCGDLISNDDVAAWVAAQPDRFAGLATVDLANPMHGVRELRRCINELGFRGLRIIPWLWDAAPTDRRYYPLYAACVDLDVPFCTQVGHTGPLRPSETGRPIPYIDRIALDFPELTIVCGHVGYPWTEEMIAVARKHDNVYIDTSAYISARLPQELIAFMQTRTGSHKVLFGTNYPMISHAHALADLDRLGLDSEARQRYLHDNATRVFRLNDAAQVLIG